VKCPSCGRLMLNMVTYFKCSNGFCDYEEDVETQPFNPMTTLPWHIFRNPSSAQAKAEESLP